MNKRELINIAKLYYELNKSQKYISNLLNISIPTVSRKLKKARKLGIVNFEIDYSYHNNYKIENKLIEKFEIKEVFVVDNLYNEYKLVYKDLTAQICAYLEEIILDDYTIGVSWGNTMSEISKNFCNFNKNNIKLVELNGGIAQSKFSTSAHSILERFSSSFGGEPYYLSVPTIVDSKDIANSLLKDSNIRHNLNIAEKSDVAIFGIGKLSQESVLYKAGYFNSKKYNDLIKKGVVGDICARFFDINGNIVDKELNKRTLGVSLDNLKNKKYSIGVAVGQNKIEPILGALNKKYINVLFTDKVTAKSILDYP